MAGRRTRILNRRSSRIGGTGVVFIAGIALPLLVGSIPWLMISGLCVLCGIGCIIAYYRFKGTRIVWAMLALTGFAVGLARSSVSLERHARAPDHIVFSGSATVTAWRERTVANFSAGTLTATSDALPYGKAVIALPTFPRYERGDGIRFACDLRKSDLKDAAHGIGYVCKKPSAVTLDPEHANALHRALGAPVTYFTRAIYDTIPEPAGSFTSGIVLGVDDRIAPAIKNNFRATGTGHIFALSGFNITIIATSIAAVLAYAALCSRDRFTVTASLIGFFVAATGASSSSVRAGMMGITILMARHVGRIARARILLPAAASAMLVHNPLVLRYDVGFQLSFLATAGILLLAKPLRERMKFLPDTMALRDTAAATVAATIATAPLLAMLGATIGPKTILANIVIGPLIPLAMASGFLGTLIAAMLPHTAPFLGPLAAIPARTVIDLADVLAHW